MMWWNGYGHMPWMFFVFLGFMVLCGAMMFSMMGGHAGRFRSRDALDILKERFARGEINQAQYEEQRRVLEN
jgi:putative membrane protein